MAADLASFDLGATMRYINVLCCTTTSYLVVLPHATSYLLPLLCYYPVRLYCSHTRSGGVLCCGEPRARMARRWRAERRLQ
jgi:hypothetical protein